MSDSSSGPADDPAAISSTSQLSETVAPIPQLPASPLGLQLTRKHALKEQDRLGEQIYREGVALWEAKLVKAITDFAPRWLSAWIMFGDSLRVDDFAEAVKRLANVDSLLDELQRIYDEWLNEHNQWFQKRAGLYHRTYQDGGEFDYFHPCVNSDWAFCWVRNACAVRTSSGTNPGPRTIPHRVAVWVSGQSSYLHDRAEPILLLGELGSIANHDGSNQPRIQQKQMVLSSLSDRQLVADLCPVLAAVVLPAPSIIEVIVGIESVSGFARSAFQWCEAVIGSNPLRLLLRAETEKTGAAHEAEQPPIDPNALVADPKTPAADRAAILWDELVAILAGVVGPLTLSAILRENSPFDNRSPAVAKTLRDRRARELVIELALSLLEAGFESRIGDIPKTDMGGLVVVVPLLRRALDIAKHRPARLAEDKSLNEQITALLNDTGAQRALADIKDELLSGKFLNLSEHLQPDWSDCVSVTQCQNIFRINKNKINAFLIEMQNNNNAKCESRQRWRLNLNILDKYQRSRYDEAIK